MMRVICLLLVSLFALKVNAQQYTKFNGYGFAADRMRSDSISIHPSDTVRNKAARSIAILNNGLYIADGTKWKLVMTDTTFLSNRINLKLNIADTINKWVTNVYKVNDSTIAVLKNGTVTNITINPAVNKLITSVYNNTGSTIVRGSVVYISGRHSSNLPTIALAEANNEANSYKTFALVQDDIPTSSSGIVIQAGKIENLNLPTSQYTDGDIVYLSPTVPGGITITKPLAPFHICKIGSVTRAHPTQGSIEIKIENGWQLDELSDVQVAAVPLDSTILQFSRVDSLWHDVNPTTAMGNRFVKRTDSAAMLSPYIRSAGYGLSKSGQSLLADSLLLSTRAWRQKGLDSLAAIELNVADTANMLNPYTRGSGTNGQIGYWNGTRSLTGSSTFAFTPTSQLLVNNSVTAASAIARGTNLTPTLTAAANNDALVGLDINPTFTNGAFTGVTNYGLRLSNTQAFFGGGSGIAMFIGDANAIRGNSTTGGNLYIDASRDLTGILHLRGNTINFPGGSTTTGQFNHSGIVNFSGVLTASNSSIASFRINNTTSAATWFFENHRNAPSGSLEITNSISNPGLTLFSTRNIAINSNTDAGFRLDVNGTARVQGTTTITGSTTASGAIARGANLTPTLVAAANNDVLVGLDVNPTFTNGAFTGVSNLSARFANNVLINGLGSNIPLLTLNSNGYANNQVSIDFTVTNSSVFSIGYYTTPSANFYIFNPTGSVFPFRIWKSTNNVGLSTTTDAGFKLDVNGTARVQGLFSALNTSTQGIVLANNTGSYPGVEFWDGSKKAEIVRETNNGLTIRAGTFSMFTSTNGTLVGGTSLSDLNASAQLQVQSTTRGFLPPRMTTTQRDAIASPAAGLVIYNTTTNKHQGYDGTNWNDFY